MATKERNKAAARRAIRQARGPHASLKWLRISPRKVRLVVDMVRGKDVEEALNILTFSPKAASMNSTRTTMVPRTARRRLSASYTS